MALETTFPILSRTLPPANFADAMVHGTLPSQSWSFSQAEGWSDAPAPAWSLYGSRDDYMGRLGYTFASLAPAPPGVSNFICRWVLYVCENPQAEYTYALLVEAGTTFPALVWLAGLPDLLAWLAVYGRLGPGY